MMASDTENKTNIFYLLLGKCTMHIACHTKVCYIKGMMQIVSILEKQLLSFYVLSTYTKNKIRIPNLILFFAKIVI